MPAAFYAALAQVLNEVYGKVIFPMGPVESPPSFLQDPSQVRSPKKEAALLLKAEKILFPKVQNSLEIFPFHLSNNNILIFHVLTGLRVV